MTKLKAALMNFVRRNHRNAAAGLAARLSSRFLKAYYNENFWNIEENGEARLIDAVASLYPTARALDVGANRGQWSDVFLAACPQGSVICFEVLPQIRTDLERRFASDRRVQIADCGLSDTAANIAVSWNKTYDTTSGISVDAAQDAYRNAIVETVSCPVVTGDDYLAAHPVDGIEFLKIDTEGHEVSVLLGFRNTLTSPRAPRCIQFEYGMTYLANHRTLRDVYNILEPAGYAIGRLYPDGVAFKDYDVLDDHFRLGNYVAVKNDDALKSVIAL